VNAHPAYLPKMLELRPEVVRPVAVHFHCVRCGGPELVRGAGRVQLGAHGLGQGKAAVGLLPGAEAAPTSHPVAVAHRGRDLLSARAALEDEEDDGPSPFGS